MFYEYIPFDNSACGRAWSAEICENAGKLVVVLLGPLHESPRHGGRCDCHRSTTIIAFNLSFYMPYGPVVITLAPHAQGCCQAREDMGC